MKIHLQCKRYFHHREHGVGKNTRKDNGKAEGLEMEGQCNSDQREQQHAK